MPEFNWLGLIVFSSILLGTPGPAVISLLYSGINYGFKRSLPYFFGIIAGFLFNLLISALGAGVLLNYAVVYNALKYAMLAYIFYLAYKIATSTPLNKKEALKPLNFSQGVLLNLLNPKAYVASLSAISQFSVVDYYVYSAFWVVAINLVIVVLVNSAWCLAGQTIRHLFAHPKWYRPVNYFLGVMLVLSVVLTYAR